jgi:hypothetical protein
MSESVPESRPIAGWLFVGPARRMWHAPRDLIVANGVYWVERPCFCWHGLEPSERPCDAVLNARGSTCCRVSAWGEVVRGRDRFVASNVRVEWVEDASEVLRSFAGDTAGEDPVVAASRAIRAAIPAWDSDDDKKPGVKAKRDRAERAARDRLDERLAGMLEGLRRAADEGPHTVVATAGHA